MATWDECETVLAAIGRALEAFAAAEAHLVSRRPTLVFATTGPGFLNALTGLMAARWDGAKVILVTGITSAALKGRWGVQETSSYTMPAVGTATAMTVLAASHTFVDLVSGSVGALLPTPALRLGRHASAFAAALPTADWVPAWAGLP